MKKLTLALGAAAAALLTGCVVSSVHPFYTEKDLVFEPAVVGDWLKHVDSGRDEIWRFEKCGDLGYRFTLYEKQKATVMEAHAFKLKGQLFLEVASIQQDVQVIPPHFLLKVTQLKPSFHLSYLDNDWLRALLAKDPTAAAHCLVRNGEGTDDFRVVLTGTTAELQKFVLAHLNSEGAWKSFDLKPEAK